MSKVIILGSSNSIASENHENTHMVFQGENRTVLIDTVGNSVLRLKRVGIDHKELTDIVLTHFHPDHISGISLLLMSTWLLGRKNTLNIIGLRGVLEQVKQVMRFHGADDWPDLFPINWVPVPEHDMYEAIKVENFRLLTSPVNHIVPTIGLRIELGSSDKIFAYSSDTEPCDSVVDLGRNADVFIHEATGPFFGHSSATQAGKIASSAGARSLYLIHYPTFGPVPAPSTWAAEAKAEFEGPVQCAVDFMEIDLGE